jgi:hypothetical protein
MAPCDDDSINTQPALGVSLADQCPFAITERIKA